MSKTKTIKVIPYQRLLICNCGKKMRGTGIVIDTLPPLYEYICDSCGAKESYDTFYPHIIYVRSNPIEGLIPEYSKDDK